MLVKIYEGLKRGLNPPRAPTSASQTAVGQMMWDMGPPNQHKCTT